MTNLNLLFHKIYYDKIGTNSFKSTVEASNKEMFTSVFVHADDFQKCDIPDISVFHMKTKYPGLLIGTGYPHGAGGADDEIKCGFSFDYVSGQPYIPGSSVKGALRSHFKDHPEAVAAIANVTKENVKDLEANIFDHGDIFLDAVLYESNDGNQILGAEYLTPHSDITKNPIPIHIMKVLPGVRFEFRFIVNDFENGEFAFTKEQKIELFKKLLELFGIGAKTNVGYGILESDDSPPRARVPQKQGLLQTDRNYGDNPRGGNGNGNGGHGNGYSSNHRGYGNNTANGNGAVFGSEKVKCPHCGWMNYKYNKQGKKHTRCFNCSKDLPK